MTTGGRIDFDQRYALIPGVRVLRRDAGTVQIGFESPHALMLHAAPTNAHLVLGSLASGRRAGEIVQHVGGDPLVWRRLLEDLLHAGLLARVESATAPPPHLQPERAGLTFRYGPAEAERILQARGDAVVLVHGTGRVAGGVAASLAAAGVGHIHQQSISRCGADGPAAGPRPSAWQASPTVRVHAPSGQVRPTMVMLAGEIPPDLALAAELTASRIPHLAARAGLTVAIVGPLVLPGRSSCLNCAERARTDLDPGWPAVAEALAGEPVVPPVLVADAAVRLAAEQALCHLDGRTQPSAVDGTLEHAVGALSIRRRSWHPHPECGCRHMHTDRTPGAAANLDPRADPGPLVPTPRRAGTR